MSWSDRLVSRFNDRRDTGGNAAGGRVASATRAATGGLASVVNGVRPSRSRMLDFDYSLLWVAIALLGLGVVMVYSASIAMPEGLSPFASGVSFERSRSARLMYPSCRFAQ